MLGEVLRRLGDLAAAEREIQTAAAMAIPDPGYHASFLGDVPENARTLALAAAWLGDPAPPHPAGD